MAFLTRKSSELKRASMERRASLEAQFVKNMQRVSVDGQSQRIAEEGTPLDGITFDQLKPSVACPDPNVVPAKAVHNSLADAPARLPRVSKEASKELDDKHKRFLHTFSGVSESSSRYEGQAGVPDDVSFEKMPEKVLRSESTVEPEKPHRPDPKLSDDHPYVAHGDGSMRRQESAADKFVHLYDGQVEA